MLRHTDLSGSDLFAYTAYYEATVDFTEANLANADLSGSWITAESREGDTTIDFAKANLTNADLSGSRLTAASGKGVLPENAGVSTIDFTDSIGGRGLGFGGGGLGSAVGATGTAAGGLGSAELLPPSAPPPGDAKTCKIKSKKCKKKPPKSMNKCKKNCRKDGNNKKPLCQKTCCELGFPVSPPPPSASPLPSPP